MRFLKPKPIRAIPKKPCPYCGKKLQKINLRRWRNNLARHLGRACAPYERACFAMSARLVLEVIRRYTPLGERLDASAQGLAAVLAGAGSRYSTLIKTRAEVEELEKLYTLEGKKKDDHSTTD